ncbi:MAG: quercetin 2,3-dioxygenase [Acidobacteriia bacterium]|nr:quercetin 2,3-dioxygenase [Terriglobia bacterium]
MSQRSFHYLGSQVRVHADAADTNGQFAMLEFRAFPGTEPPLHVHKNEDEFILLLEGRMEVTVGGNQRVVEAGDSVHFPRGVPHTFRILTPSIRTVGVITPAGFEEFFRGLAGDTRPSFERIAQAAAQYGTQFC